MKIAQDSLLREPVFKVSIIVIPLLIIGLVILNHDMLARADNAEKSLESQATSATDCTPLRWMTMDHQDDWFPAKYVILAKQRMIELKC